MSASTVYYLVTTDITGPNTTIDIDHADLWTGSGNPNATCGTAANCNTFTIGFFNPTFDWNLQGGILTIKQNAAIQPITLGLYEGNTLLDSATVLPAGVTNQYLAVNFFFTNPDTLLSGHQYYMNLTSPASTAGNVQYFIKDNASAIQDINGAPLTAPAPPPPAGPVPEPGSLAIGMVLASAAVVGGLLRNPTRRN